MPIIVLLLIIIAIVATIAGFIIAIKKKALMTFSGIYITIVGFISRMFIAYAISCEDQSIPRGRDAIQQFESYYSYANIVIAIGVICFIVGITNKMKKNEKAQ